MKKLRIAVRSFADFESALASQLAAHQSVHPAIDVQVVPMDLRGLEHAVLGNDGMRSGNWDLAIFPTDWIGSAVRTNTLECLGSWMKAKPLPDWPEGWSASLREPLRRGDDFYCIPWHDGPECLIYRKDLFEDVAEQQAFADHYGRDLAPPRTWSDFQQVAQFFTRPSQQLYGTLFAAFPDGHNTLYDLVLQVWSRGAELYEPQGNPTLAGPAVVDALDFYRSVVRDPGTCYPGAAEIDSIRSGDIFLSGQIAMMVNWFGFAARCNRGNSPLIGKIGLAPIPGGAPGQTATLNNYWVLGIGSGSQQKQESYDLLRHIASPAMDKLTALNGAVGVRLSTWSDAEVLERIPLYSELGGLSVKARTLPFCEDLPNLAEIINDVTVDALGTHEPSADILRRAQTKAIERGLRLI